MRDGGAQDASRRRTQPPRLLHGVKKAHDSRSLKTTTSNSTNVWTRSRGLDKPAHISDPAEMDPPNRRPVGLFDDSRDALHQVSKRQPDHDPGQNDDIFEHAHEPPIRAIDE